MKSKINLPKKFSSVRVEGRVYLKAPKEFCIYPTNKNHIGCNAKVKNTFEYLEWVHKLMYEYGELLHLDFSDLERLGSAASVILFAEITKAQLISEYEEIVIFTLPNDDSVKSLFRKTDFQKAISPGGHRKLVSLFDDNNHYQSGTDPNKFNVSTLLGLTQQGVRFAKPEMKLFSRGIQEAMLNVLHHAYDGEEELKMGIGNRWWQCSFYDKDNRVLIFIIYDSGKGIPLSIDEVAPTNMDDGEKIEYVMRSGISRITTDAKRGTGYEDIIRIATISDKSKLLVYSGKGIYYLDKVKKISKCGVHQKSVSGTLIEWQIPYE